MYAAGWRQTRPAGRLWRPAGRAGRRRRWVHQPSQTLADDAALTEVLVLAERSLEVTEEPDPGLLRASAWRDAQFQPADLALLRAVVAWMGAATGGCEHLQLMGAPQRSGNGRRPELAVCRDRPMVPGARRTPCLVYQLGVAADWTLAEQMARNGCRVFVLDHREQAEPEGERSYHVQFRRLGVGRSAYSAAGGRVLTLDGLMRELGHQRRQLRLLRADLNGLETDMLLDQLVDPKSRLDRRCVLERADQLSLRLYLRSRVERELPFYRQLGSALRQLDRLGFELVHSAPVEAGGRWMFPGQAEPMTLIHDVLLVRKRPAASEFSANMVP